MSEIAQRYTLHIMTLSPVHIGTGRELLKDYDFAVHGKRTWRINEDALLDDALGDGEFSEALLLRPAAELLRDEDYRKDSRFFRYVVPGTPRSQARNAALREQIKDAFDRPYLPGSSLKGALRTALVDHGLAQNPQVLDTRRLGRNRKYAARPLEQELLGRDPNHDLLRALHVADSDPVAAGRSLSIENVQVLSGGEPGSPIEVEALRSKVKMRTSIVLDLSLFSPAAERELHFGQQRKWLEDLMGVCRERVKPILAAEHDRYARRRGTEQLAEFYGTLSALVEDMRDTRSVLQVGWGGGWLTKTVGSRLDDRQREDVINNYRLARGKRQRGDPFPKRRRVVVDGNGQIVSPLGWVLLEMKPEVST